MEVERNGGGDEQSILYLGEFGVRGRPKSGASTAHASCKRFPTGTWVFPDSLSLAPPSRRSSTPGSWLASAIEKQPWRRGFHALALSFMRIPTPSLPME